MSKKINVEDVVEEIAKPIFELERELLQEVGRIPRPKEGVRKWLTKTLTSLVQQSKEEERAKVGNRILAEKRWVWNAPMKEMADWIHSLRQD